MSITDYSALTTVVPEVEAIVQERSILLAKLMMLATQQQDFSGTTTSILEIPSIRKVWLFKRAINSYVKLQRIFQELQLERSEHIFYRQDFMRATTERITLVIAIIYGI